MEEQNDEILDLDEAPPPGPDGRIVRMVNQILEQALRAGASDIHIEPFEDSCAIRLRVDGSLRELPPPPRSLFVPIVSRFKILAKMDIAEKRVPQDGAIALRSGDKRVDLRVSTVPTVYGEKMVMRILDKGAIPIELTGLGFDERQSKDLIESIQMPHGLMLVTGPTGSGKSTTLYACLNKLNEPDTNICTVEDPVEYKFKGMNQVQVKAQVGLTFAGALRAFLRQDPDVIMVGEVRDQETAQICLRAALTGHFVLSTIHTNDSLSAVNRLQDMGIEPFLLASTLRVLEAQRLIRRLCKECKEPYECDAGDGADLWAGGRANALSPQGVRRLPRGRLPGPGGRVRGGAHHAPHGQPDPNPHAAARAPRGRPRPRHEIAVGQRHGQGARRIDQPGRSFDRCHERRGIKETAHGLRRLVHRPGARVEQAAQADFGGRQDEFLSPALDAGLLRHAALAGAADLRRPKPERQAGTGVGSDGRARGGGQFGPCRGGQFSRRLPASLGRSHSHRRNHRPDGPRATGVEQANRRLAADRPQGERGPHVPHHPDLLRRGRRDGHALVRHPHLLQNVQGHGGGTARHDAVRGQSFQLRFPLWAVCRRGARLPRQSAFANTEKPNRAAVFFIGVGIGLPLVGDLIVQSAMYRFSSNIALLLKSGIPMMETLNVLEGIFQTNPVYRDALARVQNRVAAGRSLAASLEETGLFTTMITNMVRIGEESGQLALVMEQIAPYYKEKMETMIARVTKLLEPVIIMGMGSTVAGLMLSIYLPMFEMAGKVH